MQPGKLYDIDIADVDRLLLRASGTRSSGCFYYLDPEGFIIEAVSDKCRWCSRKALPERMSYGNNGTAEPGYFPVDVINL